MCFLSHPVVQLVPYVCLPDWFALISLRILPVYAVRRLPIWCHYHRHCPMSLTGSSMRRLLHLLRSGCLLAILRPLPCTSHFSLLHHPPPPSASSSSSPAY